MDIPVQDARNLYTKKLVEVYKERTTPTGFLRSFFPAREYGSKEISIEVQRGTEKIAVDVERGTEGNRNSFSRSTEKIFVPPYYREYFDCTELDLYDRMFSSSGTVDEVVVADFINEVADRLRILQDKIERRYELQCAQVFNTGIVTLNKGTNIDFKRKADSLVNDGQYWASGSVDPFAKLEAGANFIRKEGKSMGDMFNVIMGSSALTDFLNNTKVKERADIRNFFMDQVNAPQRNSVGASTHGEVTGGSYRFRIWTYPQFYDDASGVSTPYIDSKKIIILPETPNFKLVFAAVPRLLTTGVTTTKGAFVTGDYIDARKHSHVFDIRSAGVALPISIDQLYTSQVVS